ncbi:hypothetical protein ABT369_05030 [Dactylosporangium sp. NPDC000244]|uniref:hypothetical protein n=1 Tax=Dactylosporangium sp. NPDC000244 TaxID=3154365 RepID=UPI003322AB52
MEVVDMSVELHDAIDSMSKVQNPAEQQHLVQSAVELIPPGQREAVVEDVASSVLGSPSKWGYERHLADRVRDAGSRCGRRHAAGAERER